MFRRWSNCVNLRGFRAGNTKELASDKAHRQRRTVPEIELLETRITPSKLTLLPANLPNLTVGQKPQVAFTARNGDGHYRYRLVSGVLPTGLELGSKGLLAGEAEIAGTYSFAVKVTDPTRGGKSATRSFSLTVRATATAAITTTTASVTQFAITAPATVTTGGSFYISVTAKNSAGTTMIGYTGSVTLTSSDGQSLHLTAPLVFSMGTAQAAVTLDTANAVTLMAASGTSWGTSGPIAVGAAQLSTFVIHTPSTTTSDVTFPVTVTAEDAYGNTVAGFDGGLTLTSSDGQSLDLSATPVFHNGTANVSLALTKADQLTLTAKASGVAGTSNTITNNPPQVSNFVVSAPATATAGVAFPVTLTAEDQFGDTVTGFDGDVTLTGNGVQPVTLQSPLSFNNGMAVATATLAAAGTSSLIATSGSAVGTSGNIVVDAGPVSTLAVSAPSAAVAATGFSVTVTAEDSFGNTVTNFDGSATITSSDGQAVDLMSPMVFTDGTAVVNVALDTADTVTLTAVAGAIQDSSGWIVVNTPPSSRFVMSEPSSATAGVGFTLTVTAEDDTGDVLTSFDGAVTLTSSDSQQVNLLAPLIFNDGIARTTVALDTADSVTLTATSGTTTGTSGTIVNSPAAASRFIISAPATATVGIGFAVTIAAEDAFGNIVPGFSAARTLASSDGQAVVLLSAPVFSGGLATVNAALNATDTVVLSAVSGTIRGVSGSVVLSTRSVMNDWFSQNMPDLNLQDLARSDFARDGSLSYNDILALLDEAESEGPLSAPALRSLQNLVTAGGAAAVNMPASVRSLTYKVVDGDPANSQYGNLTAGSSAPQLQGLVNQWFRGDDLPAIDMTNLSGEAVGYVPATGTLFGSGGPSYKDVFQGEEGDCWLLASFAETAAMDPAIIQSMFADDGTVMENGVQDHIWTVRFYDNGVTSYLTVNNELPESNGEFVYAGGFQPTNAPNNVLWVPLLEKAYAQLSASGWNGRPQSDAYTALNSGDASMALPVITGVPESSSFALASQSSLAGAVDAQTLMTLASFSDGGDSAPNSLGVVPDHDYAVLGYDATNQTFTLLNPWGWNSSKAPGILNLSYSQITQNFYLDGNCSTVSTACFAAETETESQIDRSISTGLSFTPASASLDAIGIVGIIDTSAAVEQGHDPR